MLGLVLLNTHTVSILALREIIKTAILLSNRSSGLLGGRGLLPLSLLLFRLVFAVRDRNDFVSKREIDILFLSWLWTFCALLVVCIAGRLVILIGTGPRLLTVGLVLLMLLLLLLIVALGVQVGPELTLFVEVLLVLPLLQSLLVRCLLRCLLLVIPIVITVWLVVWVSLLWVGRVVVVGGRWVCIWLGVRISGVVIVAVRGSVLAPIGLDALLLLVVQGLESGSGIFVWVDGWDRCWRSQNEGESENKSRENLHLELVDADRVVVEVNF